MKFKVLQEPGEKFSESTIGSLENTMANLHRAFFHQLVGQTDFYWVEETYSDYLIVGAGQLQIGLFHFVPFVVTEKGYEFTHPSTWEVVQLAYVSTKPLGEAVKGKFKDSTNQHITLVEGAPKQNQKSEPTGWRIRGVGLTANIRNANGRIYPASVLESAVNEAQRLLHTSSLSQGRRVILTGEAEHPQHKTSEGRSSIAQTAIIWDAIKFDKETQMVYVEGQLLNNSVGRDIHAIMEAGYYPDLSQRGYGSSRKIDVNGEPADLILELTITGYDVVMNGSDPQGRLTFSESQNTEHVSLMNIKDALLQFAKSNPTAFSEAQVAFIKQASEADLAPLAETFREVSPTTPDLKLTESMAALVQNLKDSDDLKKANRKVIVESTASFEPTLMKFGPTLGKGLVSQLTTFAQTAVSVDEVKAFSESLVTDLQRELAQARIKNMGGSKGQPMTATAVSEKHTGIPEFASAATLIESEYRQRTNDTVSPYLPQLGESRNARYTRAYLEAFDKSYRTQLTREGEALQEMIESELTTDLDLPYSVSRAVIAQTLPKLISLSLFDYGLVTGSPFTLFYENYSRESGTNVTITDEVVVGVDDTWVAMAHQRLIESTVVVTNSAGSTTYVVHDDYEVDIANGRLYIYSGGTITNGQSLKVDYQYASVREGEMAAIKRGKAGLTSLDTSVKADRLATQISDEAITFSNSQLGWDAVTRTISMLVRDITEIVDSGTISLACAQARISGQVGGTWTAASDPLDDLVTAMGAAQTLVRNSLYDVHWFGMSLTTANLLAGWSGFKRDGFPDAVLSSAGFVGSVRGTPVYQSQSFADDIVVAGNREVVQHRVLESRTLSIQGPFQSTSSDSLVSGKQYFAQEYNSTSSNVPEKAAYVNIA